MIFLGLNPSRASKSIDDPTLKRLIYACNKWHYGSLVVINLFARVSSSPAIIKHSLDPIGNKNDDELAIRSCQWSQNPLCDLWLGWGNHGIWRNRNVEVLNLIRSNSIKRNNEYPFARGPLIIGLTKKGHPRHPLYSSFKDGLRPFDFI